MKFLFKAGVFCGFIILSACSVWQSEGRKFLEKQAFEYTGAQAYLLTCSDGADGSGWTPIPSPEGQAAVYRASDSFDLRIVPAAERAFACDYRFSSETDLQEQIPYAIQNTWAHYYAP